MEETSFKKIKEELKPDKKEELLWKQKESLEWLRIEVKQIKMQYFRWLKEDEKWKKEVANLLKEVVKCLQKSK